MGESLSNAASPGREALLREIYEDNLVIHGKASRVPPRRSPAPAQPPQHARRPGSRRRVWGLLVLLLAALGLLQLTRGPLGPWRGDGAQARAVAVLTPDALPAGVAASTVTEQPSAVPVALPPVLLEAPTSLALGDLLSALRLAAPPDPVSPTALAGPLVRAEVPLKELFGLGVHTIVLDPGHGGKDPGTRGDEGTVEKDITLDLARRLRERLVAKGFRVLLTREDDRFVSLKERAAFANRSEADLFVSLHVNYLPNTTLNVIETYYFGPHSDPDALELAEWENRGSDYGVGEFDRLVRRLADTVKLQESQVLARSIQDHLFANIRRQGRKVLDVGIKTAPFVVLLGVEAPGVLAEVSCLSSPEEEARLRTPAYREKMAGYLAEGIAAYLKNNAANGDPTHGNPPHADTLAERE